MSDNAKLAVSFSGGIFAGICAAVVSQPADTVLSKINQEKVEGSVMKASLRIMKNLGPSGLFLGE